jgi:hypothetical protein
MVLSSISMKVASDTTTAICHRLEAAALAAGPNPTGSAKHPRS